MARSMSDIADFISNMKFRKTMFGGVDEASVLRQMASLQDEYRSLYEEQKQKEQILLEEKDRELAKKDEEIARLRQLLEEKDLKLSALLSSDSKTSPKQKTENEAL